MTALRVSCFFISSLLIVVTSRSAVRLNNARNRIQLGKRQLYDVSKRTTRCLAKLHFQLVQKASERGPWFRSCFWCHFRSGSAHILIFGPIFSDVTVQTRTPEFQHRVLDGSESRSMIRRCALGHRKSSQIGVAIHKRGIKAGPWMTGRRPTLNSL